MRTLSICLAVLCLPSPALARDRVPKNATCLDLVGLLKSDQDEDTRKSACKRLADHKNLETIPAIGEALLKDASVKVRLECLSTLRKMGPDPRSASAVREAALKDSERKVRGEAMEAVPYVDPDVGGEVALSVLAQDREPEVRRQACRAIEKKGWKNVEVELNELVADAKEPSDVRRSCLAAVVSIGSDAGYALVGRLLTDAPVDDVRREAAAQLDKHPRPSSLGPLCKALSDKNQKVVADAAKALKTLGLRDGARCLREAAKGRLASEMEKYADELEK